MRSLSVRLSATTVLSLLLSCLAMAQPVRVLDDFSTGDQVINASTGPSFGIPAPGVLTDNRILLMVEAEESSAASISVGGGRLTWVEASAAGFGDFGAMYDDSVTAGSTDLSAYDAFQLTVVSAPLNSGSIDFMMVFTAPGQVYSARATASIPSSGIVTVPFASLITGSASLPIDLTRVRGVGLEFGNQSSLGTYVFDDFLAITAVPESSTVALMILGLVFLGLGLKAKAP